MVEDAVVKFETRVEALVGVFVNLDVDADPSAIRRLDSSDSTYAILPLSVTVREVPI